MSYETLWAPWRLDYIKQPDRKPEPHAEECFLCRYRAAHEQDADNFVVLRGETTFIVLNRFPYNNGHLLVAPLAHVGNLNELDDACLLESQQHVRRMVNILTAKMNAEGFNVGLNLGRVAGAGLPGHLHWHVVPRWNGDSNFMTVVGATNVIPQSLRALYDILQTALAEA